MSLSPTYLLHLCRLRVTPGKVLGLLAYFWPLNIRAGFCRCIYKCVSSILRLCTFVDFTSCVALSTLSPVECITWRGSPAWRCLYSGIVQSWSRAGRESPWTDVLGRVWSYPRLDFYFFICLFAIIVLLFPSRANMRSRVIGFCRWLARHMEINPHIFLED
jgi:hypothetical protein